MEILKSINPKYKYIKLSNENIRGVIKNYVEFSHNLTMVQANIFKF